MLSVIIIISLITILGFIIRTSIIWGTKGYGCDAFYFLTCRRVFLAHKKFPIRLPHYLLDIEEQWYPPFFTFFLCAIPNRILEKYHWLINPLIDSFQLLIVLISGFVLTKNIGAVAVGGVFYVLSPTLIIDTMSMNVRPLSSFIVVVCILSLFYLLQAPSIFAYSIFVMLCILLFLTHKMSIQCVVAILVVISIAYHTVVPVGLFLCSIIILFIISRGFYAKIFKGHIDILKFWKRNIQNLGAHQFYDSKLYVQKHRETRMYMPGLQGIFKLIKIIVSYNPLILFIIIVLLCDYKRLYLNDGIIQFCILWIGGVYLMVLMTSFIKQLRFLGEGWKYIKYSIFPCTIMLIRYMQNGLCAHATAMQLLLVGFFAINIVVVIFVINKMKRSLTAGKIDESFQKIWNYVKNAEIDKIMCIPTQLCDAIVFYCDKKVLWGTHSSNYEVVEEFFPVIQKPIEYFVNKYNIDAIIINNEYAKISAMDVYKEICAHGTYSILSCKDYVK